MQFREISLCTFLLQWSFWFVSVGLDDGLARTGDIPLPEQMMTQLPNDLMRYQWPLLLTWFNFNPSMDK